MKIITKGIRKPFWFVGQRMTCPSCGEVTELESDDQWRINVNVTHEKLTLECPTCGTHHSTTNPTLDTKIPLPCLVEVKIA